MDWDDDDDGEYPSGNSVSVGYKKLPDELVSARTGDPRDVKRSRRIFCQRPPLEVTPRSVDGWWPRARLGLAFKRRARVAASDLARPRKAAPSSCGSCNELMLGPAGPDEEEPPEIFLGSPASYRDPMDSNVPLGRAAFDPKRTLDKITLALRMRGTRHPTGI